jgi:hypothetical protein
MKEFILGRFTSILLLHNRSIFYSSQILTNLLQNTDVFDFVFKETFLSIILWLISRLGWYHASVPLISRFFISSLSDYTVEHTARHDSFTRLRHDDDAGCCRIQSYLMVHCMGAILLR